MIYILTCFVKLNMTILRTPLQKPLHPLRFLRGSFPKEARDIQGARSSASPERAEGVARVSRTISANPLRAL